MDHQEREPVTVDEIMAQMKDWVENRKTIGPDVWLTVASKINVLQQDEEDKKIEYEVNYNIRVKSLMEGGASHAGAQVSARTTEEYKQFKKQEARCRIITEFVKIAKKRATVDSEWRSV